MSWPKGKSRTKPPSAKQLAARRRNSALFRLCGAVGNISITYQQDGAVIPEATSDLNAAISHLNIAIDSIRAENERRKRS